MPFITRRAVLAACVLVVPMPPSLAGAEADPVLLTVVDAATGRQAAFTRSEIDALPQAVIATRTDFTEGRSEFRGPLAADLLDRAGIGAAREVRLVAANDYAVTVPVADFRAYGVILATELDGRRLSLRDRGPIWVMYPADDFPELRQPQYVDRLIWQLVRIEAR